jgi:hypothetical protein
MIAYVDSSVLLRVALGQPNALPEWRDIERGVSSSLVTTESLRTLDRVRLRASLSDIEVARRRATILALIDSLELVEIDQRTRPCGPAYADRTRHSRCDSFGIRASVERSARRGPYHGHS